MAFKIFPKQKKIPTLIGIFILMVGIGVTTYLTQRAQLFFLKAEPTVVPQNVKITNITSQTFSVSWLTAGNPSPGYIKYGKSSSLGKVGLDDRDQKIESLGQYIVHHITIGGLEPQTTYYFKIVSQSADYGQEGNPYSVKTLATSTTTNSLNPTHGIILEEDGIPLKEGLVYVKVGNSNLASTLVKSSGNWLVPLAPLVNQDLKNPLQPAPNDSEEIFVQGTIKTSRAITSLKNNSPVPTITLGEDFDFRLVNTEEAEEENVSVPPGFSLTQPASDAAIPGQPFFRGTGDPGTKIKIKIESESPVNGEATVDSSGNWIWQPPENLPPGEHTVTVTTTDSQGNPQAIIRKFIILASGAGVIEAATPSATPTSKPSPSPTPTTKVSLSPTPSSTPTATPSPTSSPTPSPTPRVSPTPTPSPKLTLSPTPVATGASLPTSGDLLLTLILATSGIGFVLAGFLFLKAQPVKRVG